MLYLHGNASCRLDALKMLDMLILYKISLFAFDFAGCGLSEGEYITLGPHEVHDIEVVVEHLLKTNSVGPQHGCRQQRAVWGAAGAPAAHPAVHLVMILDSPFASLTSVAEDVVNNYNKFLPRAISSQVGRAGLPVVRKSIMNLIDIDIKTVETLTAAARCNIPALVFHGRDDDFVQPKQSQLVFDALMHPAKEYCLIEGTHNSHRDYQYYDKASAFINEHFLGEDLKRASPLKVFGDLQTSDSVFYAQKIILPFGDVSEESEEMEERSQQLLNQMRDGVILQLSPKGVNVLLTYTTEVEKFFNYRDLHLYGVHKKMVFWLSTKAEPEKLEAFGSNQAQQINEMVEKFINDMISRQMGLSHYDSGEVREKIRAAAVKIVRHKEQYGERLNAVEIVSTICDLLNELLDQEQKSDGGATDKCVWDQRRREIAGMVRETVADVIEERTGHRPKIPKDKQCCIS
eukprot:CAMPEP_0177684440 /NCGR_PEP_ID=MMETSP0447-20121125/32443_1 /TAXON_ID=0 /ORGANISM="Stygamoeba regulata, Strain BSH-02190019" /LENGTH=459 /DNA_ID=CAMNT_0019194309 /DNA_START=600 /DNA_END=1980 /DNA_ORIENTATION=-